MCVPHLILPPVEDAVETAEDDERQRDVPVFVRLERATEDVIGHLPDEVGFGLEGGGHAVVFKPRNEPNQCHRTGTATPGPEQTVNTRSSAAGPGSTFSQISRPEPV